jgi:hypothetical protein
VHQRSGSAGGGYRLWALAIIASPLATPPAGSTSVAGGQLPLEPPTLVPQLQVGTPSIASPGSSQPGWAVRLAQALMVRGDTLALVGLEGVGLVVLPSCEGAQVVPGGIRAGGMVDRAGRAPYPQLW